MYIILQIKMTRLLRDDEIAERFGAGYTTIVAVNTLLDVRFKKIEGLAFFKIGLLDGGDIALPINIKIVG